MILQNGTLFSQIDEVRGHDLFFDRLFRSTHLLLLREKNACVRDVLFRPARYLVTTFYSVQVTFFSHTLSAV